MVLQLKSFSSQFVFHYDLSSFFAVRGVLSKVPTRNEPVNDTLTSFPGSLIFPSPGAEGRKRDPGNKVDTLYYRPTRLLKVVCGTWLLVLLFDYCFRNIHLVRQCSNRIC